MTERGPNASAKQPARTRARSLLSSELLDTCDSGIRVDAIVRSLSPMPSHTIEGNEIRFVKVVERKFFGFKTYDLYGREAVISTPVKTVVDCLDRPDLAGGAAEVTRIFQGAAVDADPEEVVDVAFRLKSVALLQRLGFLADLVGWEWPEALRLRLRAAIPPSTRSVLGRVKRKEGDIGYVASWGLLVHARADDLLADVPKAKTVRAIRPGSK
ncbi:MAG: hypothetical protein NT049_01555 [Planctomycetota bacterium]|nr:hypothetical protein [Planctomycetota bacterium]